MAGTAVLRNIQRLGALERANQIRLGRAALKRRIAGGEISAHQVLLDPPHEAQSWATFDLLMSQPRWGRVRCRKFLARYQIAETRPLAQLTDRQRRLLARQLINGHGRLTATDPLRIEEASP